jgi:histidine triad (HIT) family protein
METCVFCRIVRKEIPADIVYSDKHFLAFLDIHPVQEGHLLLIPKNHHASMTETPDGVVREIFSRARMLMPVLRKAAGADFVALSIVGTDVPHFHIHLIPRMLDDGLGGFWPAKASPDAALMKEIAGSIRESL